MLAAQSSHTPSAAGSWGHLRGGAGGEGDWGGPGRRVGGREARPQLPARADPVIQGAAGAGGQGRASCRGREVAGATPKPCRLSLYLILGELGGSSEDIRSVRLSRNAALERHTPGQAEQTRFPPCGLHPGLETAGPWFHQAPLCPGCVAWDNHLGSYWRMYVSCLSLVLGAPLTLAVSIINILFLIIIAFREASLSLRQASESSDPTEALAGGH